MFMLCSTHQALFIDVLQTPSSDTIGTEFYSMTAIIIYKNDFLIVLSIDHRSITTNNIV